MALTATVGREAELDSIRAFIDAVPRGPTALSISGQAGIGKTVLWEAGVDAARERFEHVLVCRGIEAEASLSFAALSELITPVFDEVAPELTTPRRRALEVALLLVDPDGATPDPLAIGLAVLDSLRALSANGPCVVALDDAQWLDASSATVLQIALKRLDQPVGALITSRDEPGSAVPIDLERCFPTGRRSMRVDPISAPALQRLLRERLGLELVGHDLERVHAMTGGNPFFALEVGREMVRTGARTTDAAALRVPDSLRELVGGRLARLPAETTDVLVAMSALARPTIEVLARVQGDRDGVVRALDVAASEGVVRTDGGQLRFSHPLHSSICYQQAPVWKQRAVHLALADAVTDAEERALHLARSADGPDGRVAVELDEAAEIAAARGAPGVGADLLLLAATLTPEGDSQASRRRRMRAAQLDRVGNADRALATLGQLRAEVPSGPERADVLYELSMTRKFDIPAWVALCDEALREAAGDDIRSANILLSRTYAHMLKGDVRPCLADAWAALELGERAEAPEVIAGAIARIAHAETYGARPTPGLTERGVELERSLDLKLDYLGSPRVGLARRLWRMGELDKARELLEEVARDARSRGDELQHGQALWGLSNVEWLAGNWTKALENATLALQEGELFGEGHLLCITGRVRGPIEADLGLVDDARRTAERGAAAAREMCDDFAEVLSLGVLGRVELMLGNSDTAATILEDLPGRLVDLGIVDPTAAVWADAVEASLAARRLEQARDLFAQWEPHARELDSPLSTAMAARCRGLVAAADNDFAGAEASFRESLAALDGVGYPCERARTLLSRGVVLRQANQRTAARESLEAALAIFEELGGVLWAEKARGELARDQRPPARVRDPHGVRASGRRARRTRAEQQGHRGVTPHGCEHRRSALVERLPQARRETGPARVGTGRAVDVMIAPTIGRGEELAAIDAFLDAVPSGARALLLAGEAGMGKTTLWEHAVEAAGARFSRVLSCRGIETESSLSFAALSDLLGPVFDEIAPALAGPRRRALEVVLLLAEPGDATPDSLAIGLAVLDALRALTSSGPCVLALDDIQWLDAASAAALQIALRRLDAEPLAVLATFRHAPGLSIPIDLDRSFDAARLTKIDVGPLDLAALHHLLRERVALDLTRPELVRLHSITRGNPFFALEVGREMVRSGTRPTEDRMTQVPETLSAALADRLARLPSETADVLLETAALARPTVELVVAAHGDRETVLSSFAAAAADGLIVLDDERVRFTHPLHASVLYQQAPIWKRRAVHRRLALVVADPEERALHLARGAEGPNAEIAAQLDATADGAATAWSASCRREPSRARRGPHTRRSLAYTSPPAASGRPAPRLGQQPTRHCDPRSAP